MSKHRSRQQGEPAQPDLPDQATLNRVVNDFVGYWRICGAANCKRRRGCAGDAIACHERSWPWTPERIKVYFRAAITAINAGAASEQEVRRIAEAEVERAAEHIARTDAAVCEAFNKREAARAAAKRAAELAHPPLEGEGRQA